MDDLGDLGAFLQSRRAQVTPASVGVPVGARRRVSGLRREELAQLAGVSVDYYTRLEQGRATQPSEQVLDALARALRLDEPPATTCTGWPGSATAGRRCPTTRARCVRSCARSSTRCPTSRR
ncbi:helix-turn-helix domain-containing protein [Streptomyces sp. SBR177]